VRASSTPVAATLIVLVVLGSALLLYTWLHHGAVPRAPAEAPIGGAVKVDAAVAGPGYLVIYGRCTLAPCSVDTVYLQSVDGATVAAHRLPAPIRAAPGDLLVIPVALPAAVNGAVVATLSGPSLAPTRVLLRNTDAVSMAATVGLLASRGGYSDPRDANPEKIHWLYLNVIDGSYRFRYVNRGVVKDAEGRAPVYVSAGRLDLCNTTKSWREQLGPVVVFLNPYRAAADYTVVVVPASCGRERRIAMPRLVDRKDLVVLDALVLWEDQWWPGTSRTINNYLNHVVRVTLFTNATLRVEVLQATGPSLHMFLYRPAGLPSFDEVPSIVERYMDDTYVARYMLREDDGVVYVKTHDARVPPVEEGDIWDPVEGIWVTMWPPVFTAGP